MWSYSGTGGSSNDSLPFRLVAEVADLDLGYARGPERVLLTAILFDGIQAYMNYILARTDLQKRRYFEAYKWVHRESEDYVFSFDNVCEGLGIDPEYMRLGLLNAANTQDLEWKRSRRNF